MYRKTDAGGGVNAKPPYLTHAGTTSTFLDLSPCMAAIIADFPPLQNHFLRLKKETRLRATVIMTPQIR